MRSTDQIIAEISKNNGTFPREELLEIVERKEEAIPVLLDLVIDVKDNFDKYKKEPYYIAHIYSFLLLTQFRVTEFFPLFIDILKLPGKHLDRFMGDFISEYAGRVLSTVFDGDIDALKDLAQDDNVLIYARGQAIDTLKNLVINEQVSRKEVIDYYRGLLKTEEDAYIITNVISASCSLYPEELYDDIKESYNQGMVDEWVINMDDIDRTLKSSRDKIMEREKQRAEPINDIVEEMQGWACFRQKAKVDNNQLKYEQETIEKILNQPKKSNEGKTIKREKPKIGRNEKCPCGSGKKYKKCCLNR